MKTSEPRIPITLPGTMPPYIAESFRQRFYSGRALCVERRFSPQDTRLKCAAARRLSKSSGFAAWDGAPIAGLSRGGVRPRSHPPPSFRLFLQSPEPRPVRMLYIGQWSKSAGARLSVSRVVRAPQPGRGQNREKTRWIHWTTNCYGNGVFNRCARRSENVNLGTHCRR